MARTILIGDIHGCLAEFQELVEKIQLKPEDRVICLGDFMDKGPDPVGCVRFARRRGFESVLGNHEERHGRWRRHEDRKERDPSYVNPMKPMPENYQWHNAELTDGDVLWLQRLPIILTPVPGWVVVHGGLFRGMTLDRQLIDKKMRSKILRLRWVHKETGDFMATEYEDDGSSLTVPEDAVHWTALYDGRYNVIYGHEAHSLSGVRLDHLPQDVECYGIDTGCVHGGHLTALILGSPTPPDGYRLGTLGKPMVSYTQVKAKRVYEEPPIPIPA